MRTSEAINEIAAALAKAQGDIDNASKDAKNPHFKTSYADLAAVRDAIREPLSKNGIAVVQGVRSTADGVEVETMLVHSTGQFFAETLMIPVGKRDAQSIGSAISYGRRYSLMAILGVAADDDDGNAAAASPPSREAGETARGYQNDEPRTPAVNDDVIAYMARFRTSMRACESEPELRDLWADNKQARVGARLTQAQCDILLHELKQEIDGLKAANDQGRMLEAGE